MTKRSHLRAPRNHLHLELVPADTRTETDIWTDLHVSRLRLLIVNALDIPDSFQFVTEMTDCQDRDDRLMTVRSWAERVGIETRSARTIRKQELTALLSTLQSQRDELLATPATNPLVYFSLLYKFDGDIADLEKEIR